MQDSTGFADLMSKGFGGKMRSRSAIGQQLQVCSGLGFRSLVFRDCERECRIWVPAGTLASMLTTWGFINNLCRQRPLRQASGLG